METNRCSIISSINGSSGSVQEKLDTVLDDVIESLKSDHERLKHDLLELSQDQKRLTVVEVEKAALELRFQFLEEQSNERQEFIEKLQAKEVDFNEKLVPLILVLLISLTCYRIKLLEAEIGRLSVVPPEDPRIAAMQHTIEELSAKIQAAEESLCSSEDICKAEKDRFHEKSTEYDSLYAEIQILREAHQAALKRIEDFEDEKKAFVEQLEDEAKEKRMKFEKASNAFRNREIQKLNNKLTAAESQKASLEKRLEDLEKTDDQRLKERDEQVCLTFTDAFDQG